MPKKPDAPDARKFTRKLPVKLKGHEMSELKDRIVELDFLEDDQRAELALVTKPWRDKVRETVAERERVKKIVKAGEEERDVNCMEMRDYSAGEVWHIRVDTRMEVPGSRRSMTAEECQETFPNIKGTGRKLKSVPNNLDDLDNADPRPSVTD